MPIDKVKVTKLLEHYGVKGMRWGVSRSKSKTGRSAESKKVSSLRGKRAGQLSNKELKQVNERLSLESQYKSATKSHASKGKKAVGDILSNAAKTIATALLVSEGSKLAKQVITAAIKKKG